MATGLDDMCAAPGKQTPGSQAPGEQTDPLKAERIHFGEQASLRTSALSWQYSRSSGPGGQNVNKLNTRVTLRARVTDIEGLDEAQQDRVRAAAGSRLTTDDEIIISCESHRSQRANRLEALERLTKLVESALRRRKKRIRRRPTRAMIERRLERKRQKSEKKSRRQWRPE